MLKRALLALVFVASFAPKAAAQGTNVWAAGYPKTGTVAGTILVKGTATPSAGWTLTGNGSVVVWPRNGGPTTSFTISVNTMTGVWGEFTLTGLTSGQDYFVVGQAGVKMGLQQTTLAAPAVVVKAK